MRRLRHRFDIYVIYPLLARIIQLGHRITAFGWRQHNARFGDFCT